MVDSERPLELAGALPCKRFMQLMPSNSLRVLSYRDQHALILDPVTFATRYYAAQDLHSAKMVQDHDDKMRERVVEGIASWLEGIQ